MTPIPHEVVSGMRAVFSSVVMYLVVEPDYWEFDFVVQR